MSYVYQENVLAKTVKAIHRLDLHLLAKIQQFKSHNLIIRYCRYISFSADGYFYVLLGIYLLYSSQYELFNLVSLAFIIERIIYFTSKNVFKRNRPADCIDGFCSSIIPQDKFSFPSGHTSAAFLIAGTIGIWYPSLMAILYLWAVWVGLSRIILGVHFPSDTVAGAALGASVAAMVL